MDAETRRELALLRAEVAALRRQRGNWRRHAALGLVAALVALVPLGLLAANPFTDLTGGVHDANIDAIYNAGITTGCVPNAEYCPTANVTREEMASFLARTAGLGGNPPVANAKTLQGKSPADFLASTGELTYTYSFYNVVSGSTGLNIIYSPGPTVQLDPTTNLGKEVWLSLDGPRGLFGKGLAVKSLLVCYKVSGGASIFRTIINMGLNGSQAALLDDMVVRNSTTPECYTIAPPNPIVPGGALYLTLRADFPNNVTDNVYLYSAYLILTPQ
jgi:hypothetical protein